MALTPKFRPAVYAHHKRKDGSYNVKICVYFNGKERRLPTNIYCTKNDLTRTLHLKQGDVLSKVNREILRMQDAISDLSFIALEGKDVDWVVARIKTKLSQVSFRLDFFEFADEYLKKMNEGTRAVYVVALNQFALFLGERRVDINDITKRMLTEFIEWAEGRKKMVYNRHMEEVKETKRCKKKGRSTSYIHSLSALFKAAKRKYNDDDEDILLIPRSPFDNLDLIESLVEGQSPLPMDIVQRLILAEAANDRERFALDVMVVSFGLMGANMADLYNAEPPKGGVWIYHRQKTRDRRADRAEVRVEVPACLEPFLERLGSGTDGKVWLPVLRGTPKDTMTSRVNRNIKRWCDREGIKTFTTYALRKAWATIARKYEDKSIVDEAISHTGGNGLLDIYADKPWERYHELNRKVLSQFIWEKEKGGQ